MLSVNNVKLALLMLALFVGFSPMALASPLPLSQTEVQTLHHLFPAQDSEALTWKGDPLAIALPLNQEKRVIFPAHVTFDAKGALTTDQLRVINNDQSLYLTALKPLATARVYVTLQDTHEVVMLDLATADNATSATVNIAAHQNNTSATLKPPSMVAGASTTRTVAPSSGADENEAVNDNEAFVTLTRYAWQQLYAPPRLLGNPYDIVRVPMHTPTFRSDLLYGAKVVAHPLASWRYAGHTLTAVEVRNPYAHLARLNLGRDLCGAWETAMAYPRTRLQPAGVKPGDSTTLLLISDRPFAEALENCHATA